MRMFPVSRPLLVTNDERMGTEEHGRLSISLSQSALG